MSSLGKVSSGTLVIKGNEFDKQERVDDLLSRRGLLSIRSFGNIEVKLEETLSFLLSGRKEGVCGLIHFVLAVRPSFFGEMVI